MKKVYFVIVVCLLTLSGCGVRILPTIFNYDSEHFQPCSEIVLDASQLQGVRINWTWGDVTIRQSADNQLRIYEKEKNLPVSQQMHYMIQQNNLLIYPTESGGEISVSPEKKQLFVEVPEHLTLIVKNSTATINVEDLTIHSITLSTDQYKGVAVSSLTCDYFAVECLGGCIDVENLHAERFLLHQSEGDIRADIAHCGNGKMINDTGDINLLVHQGVDATIYFETKTGTFNGPERIKDGHYAWYIITDSGNLTVTQVDKEI